MVRQPTLADASFQGWNPYALGFAIMRDIERICTAPDAEDERWFPAFAGNGDPWGTLREAWAEYRDESLVRQFLGPKVMRAFRMVNLNDTASDPNLVVTEIHDDIGYRRIRSLLADQYDPSRGGPLIEATGIDLAGDRSMKLTYLSRHKQRLHDASARQTLAHLHVLWGYKVTLQEIDAESERVLGEMRAEG